MTNIRALFCISFAIISTQLLNTAITFMYVHVCTCRYIQDHHFTSFANCYYVNL